MHETNEPIGQETVGHASLWTAVMGLTLPLALAILATALTAESRRQEPPFIMCWVLFGVLELAALLCGIMAIRSLSGKAGVILSSISLVLCVVVVALGMMFFTVNTSPKTPAPVPSVMPTPQDKP